MAGAIPDDFEVLGQPAVLQHGGCRDRRARKQGWSRFGVLAGGLAAVWVRATGSLDVAAPCSRWLQGGARLEPPSNVRHASCQGSAHRRQAAWLSGCKHM